MTGKCPLTGELPSRPQVNLEGGGPSLELAQEQDHRRYKLERFMDSTAWTAISVTVFERNGESQRGTVTVARSTNSD